MAYEDTGSCIKAYCVPDSFSGQTSLKIVSAGELIHQMEPNDFNEYMEGRHETGKVGFVIDESLIPSLSQLTDLELRDSSTDILVYRRSSSEKNIQKAIFRLETQLIPQWKIDESLRHSFRFWYSRIESYSAETVRQLLSFYSFNSLYSSGRILLQNYKYYIQDNQFSAMMMQEPYCELAERLLIFNRLSTKGYDGFLSERDSFVYAPALSLSAQLATFGERELRRVLGAASPDILSVFNNPTTRQLTAATPDEMPNRTSLSRAMDELAAFAVVGLRDDSDTFVNALSELAQDDGPKHIHLGLLNADVLRIADILRSIKWIEPLIEIDLEIYHQIRAAFEATR